ncbi:MAG: hypothetical protein KME32_28490 [Mojavia pulchra JT2-VF2]|jgi:hypothetical protein|uniref:DUF2029 domain-containing protein n=1 Tax=Mojavia pulchra JT2-VF2 TaxID=287848 RepID=A0A951UIP3_9NOST|nr:hypothetical protein [Mojavia pulchra JT2-VF2]
MKIIAQQSNNVAVSPKTRWVLLIGMVSGVLYLLVYFTQRAIYLNGLSLDIANIAVRGTLADHTYLLWSVASYYAGTVALFALYLWLIVLCYRGQLRDRRASTLALLFPVLFNIGLLFGRPYLSIDIFSYIAHGYLGTTPGSNPYIDAASEVVNTPFGRQLVPWGWQPVHGISPYGPLWTQFEIAVVHLTKDVPSAILLIKSLIVSSSLLCAALIWRILGHVRPKDQLLGTLVYLWNPVVIVEFAAEGHNDALMIFFILLSLLLALQTYPAKSLVMLLLGVLTKYLPLILLPAQVIYFWRTQSTRWNQGKLLLRLLLGLATGLGLAMLLYLPLWVGAETFQGVRESSQQQNLPSLQLPLRYIFQHWLSKAEAAKWASIIVKGIFGIYVLIASLKVRNKQSLLKACGNIALVYVLVASPAYWPWYVSTPLALMTLSPHSNFWTLFVFTFCSRLVAPIDLMRVNGFTTWKYQALITTLIALMLPFLNFLMLSAGSRVGWWRRSSSVK